MIPRDLPRSGRSVQKALTFDIFRQASEHKSVANVAPLSDFHGKVIGCTKTKIDCTAHNFCLRKFSRDHQRRA
jgi:hypothetical protein